VESRTGSPSPQRRPAALLRIGRFFGVPVYFAPSWVLIATAVTVLYSSLLRSLVDDLGTGASYLAALGFAIALALCVLAHEAGHTAVSLALGRPVRRIVIYLLGGISEIEGPVERPRDELLIALAGPVVSGLLGGISGAAALFAPRGSLASVLLALLAWSNVTVAAFNLLPGLPLDGGRVLRAAVWATTRSPRTGTVIAAWIGRVLAVAIVLGGAAFLTQSWGAATFVVGVSIGTFMWIGSSRALAALGLVDRTASIRVADLLRPGVLVSADTSLAEAVRRARAAAARGIVIVDIDLHPRAIVEENRVRDVPVDRQAWTSVTEVARALEPGLIISDELTGDALMSAVRAQPAGEYLVVRPDGSPAGILAASDLAIALGGGRR
jgi:Zn-dependent protease/CBS domain-containing protein